MGSPCESKRFYDTEFEATIAAAKASGDFKAEMYAYRCGTHWHIANKNKQLRSRVRPFNRSYCQACDAYMRPGRYKRHITLAGHQRNVRKLEQEKRGP